MADTSTSTGDEAPPPRELTPEERLASNPPEWLAEFEAAARRPLRRRFRYAFLKTYEPVLDDAPRVPSSR